MNGEKQQQMKAGIPAPAAREWVNFIESCAAVARARQHLGAWRWNLHIPLTFVQFPWEGLVLPPAPSFYHQLNTSRSTFWVSTRSGNAIISPKKSRFPLPQAYSNHQLFQASPHCQLSATAIQ